MTGKATIALLIPAFNASAFLPRLLASAAAQTDPFDEIWVYDDCSADNTGEVAARLGAQVLRGEANRGCSFGKNLLAHRTDCEWVHFHDADDDLKPHFVSLARRWMADARHDVVLFDYEEVDDASNAVIGMRRFDPQDLARDARSFAIREQINAINGLYRRQAFLAAGGYDIDPRVLHNEDVAMHIALAFAGLSFGCEQDVAIVNRRRIGSMSSANGLKCVQAHYQVLRKTSGRPGAAVYSREIAGKLWRAAGVAAAYLDWETADQAASLAMRLSGPPIEDSHALFAALCRISPRMALRIREAGIRLFKPSLRSAPRLGPA